MGFYIFITYFLPVRNTGKIHFTQEGYNFGFIFYFNIARRRRFISVRNESHGCLAGGSLEKVLEKLTTGKNQFTGTIKGFTLGTAVTAIIQSSAATTIMLIGFVNAGIMKLGQAIPVVFGANIGSTATAQILRLGDLAETNILLKLLKPSSFAPILICIGAFIILFTTRNVILQVFLLVLESSSSA